MDAVWKIWERKNNNNCFLLTFRIKKPSPNLRHNVLHDDISSAHFLVADGLVVAQGEDVKVPSVVDWKARTMQSMFNAKLRWNKADQIIGGTSDEAKSALCAIIFITPFMGLSKLIAISSSGRERKKRRKKCESINLIVKKDYLRQSHFGKKRERLNEAALKGGSAWNLALQSALAKNENCSCGLKQTKKEELIKLDSKIGIEKSKVLAPAPHK